MLYCHVVLVIVAMFPSEYLLGDSCREGEFCEYASDEESGWCLILLIFIPLTILVVVISILVVPVLGIECVFCCSVWWTVGFPCRAWCFEQKRDCFVSQVVVSCGILFVWHVESMHSAAP